MYYLYTYLFYYVVILIDIRMSAVCSFSHSDKMAIWKIIFNEKNPKLPFQHNEMLTIFYFVSNVLLLYINKNKKTLFM